MSAHVELGTSNHEDLGAGSVAIAGGGLVGCLLALYLRKHGFAVTIFESRADPRAAKAEGRSINLVITSRGLHALTSLSAELAAAVMAVTTRVDGRTMHAADGATAYQSYGPDSSFCNFSVGRAALNRVLMDAAERAGCALRFEHPLAHIDVAAGALYFYVRDPAEPSHAFQRTVRAAHVIGADGGGSRCRQALRGLLRENASDVTEPLGYGYKELRMPAPSADSGAGGGGALRAHSLHIWPRGSHFLMGLANPDGSFTMTLCVRAARDESARGPPSPRRRVAG